MFSITDARLQREHYRSLAWKIYLFGLTAGREHEKSAVCMDGEKGEERESRPADKMVKLMHNNYYYMELHDYFDNLVE